MSVAACCCLLQTSSAEALPGATQETSPSLIWFDEEHHPQLAETSPASHKGRRNTPALYTAQGKMNSHIVVCPVLLCFWHQLISFTRFSYVVVNLLTVHGSLQVLIPNLLCLRFGAQLTCFSNLSLPSHFRSCRSRTSVRSRWRAACAGSRESCGFGSSSCREARRGWGTTVRGRPCRPRGRTPTEVGHSCIRSILPLHSGHYNAKQ